MRGRESGGRERESGGRERKSGGRERESAHYLLHQSQEFVQYNSPIVGS